MTWSTAVSLLSRHVVAAADLYAGLKVLVLVEIFVAHRLVKDVAFVIERSQAV